MSTIDDLKAKVTRLRDQLAAAQAAYDNARIAEHPIQPGQIFVDRKGRRGQVSRLAVTYDEVQPMIRFLKNDGTPGLREKAMYRWDEWTPEGNPADFPGFSPAQVAAGLTVPATKTEDDR